MKAELVSSCIGRLWRDYLSHYKLEIAALAPVLALVAVAGVSYASVLKYVTDALVAHDARVIVFGPLAALGARRRALVRDVGAGGAVAGDRAQSAARSAEHDVRQADGARISRASRARMPAGWFRASPTTSTW